MNCLHCGMETTNPKFCSRSCSASFTNAQSPKRKPSGRCLLCSTDIPRGRTYCDGCFDMRVVLAHRRTSDLPEKRCTLCNTVKERKEFHANGWCKVCTNQYYRTRRAALKQQCVEYKGGKCSICGYDRCLRALAFHHSDPQQKDFSISHTRTICFTKALAAELDKCILVCHNCHDEIHDALDDLVTGGGVEPPRAFDVSGL